MINKEILNELKSYIKENYIEIRQEKYSNALYSYNKPDITNEIFKKLIEELNKTKNSFIFIRTFIFIFGLIHFNVIPNQYLIDFIKEVIAKKNVKVIPVTASEFARAASRPHYSVLENKKWVENGFKPLRSYKDAIKEYLELLNE